MTLEEIDVDGKTIYLPKSSSYTMLLDYVASNYWEEEAERFTPKRKSIELIGSNLENSVEKVSSEQDLLGDAWVDSESHNMSLDEEIFDLQDAQKVMTEISSEYEMMETAAASYTSKYQSDKQQLCSNGSLDSNSLIKPQGFKIKEECEAQNEEKPKFLPFRPVVYRQNTILCRDWLMEHYELKSGVSIPRSAMYSHYLDFCHDMCYEPLNPAGFGKAVRSLFMDVKTRRLGNRGASKYHYNGLSIKEDSPYSSMVKGTQRLNNDDTNDTTGRYNMSTFHPKTLSQCTEGWTVGAVLDGFPSFECILIPLTLRVQLKTFLQMYKRHCDEVLHFVEHTNFSEVKDSVTHFWESLPDHLLSFMSQDCVANVVHLCDVALYKTIGGMLLPSISHPQPTSVLSSMREFVHKLVDWVKHAVRNLPIQIQNTKITAVKDFWHQLDRQSMLCHMIRTVKTTFRDQEIMKRILSDWMSIDQMLISKEIMQNIGSEGDVQTLFFVRKCMRDIERLLSQRASVEKYFALVSNVLHQCTSSQMPKMDVSEIVSTFMLRWTTGISTCLREFTLAGIQSFGTFHLLGMLLTDYVMYLVEERQRAINEIQLKDLVYRGETDVDSKNSIRRHTTEYKHIISQSSDRFLPGSSLLLDQHNQQQQRPQTSAVQRNNDGKLQSIMLQLSNMNQANTNTTTQNNHVFHGTNVVVKKEKTDGEIITTPTVDFNQQKQAVQKISTVYNVSNDSVTATPTEKLLKTEHNVSVSNASSLTPPLVTLKQLVSSSNVKISDQKMTADVNGIEEYFETPGTSYMGTTAENAKTTAENVNKNTAKRKIWFYRDTDKKGNQSKVAKTVSQPVSTNPLLDVSKMVFVRTNTFNNSCHSESLLTTKNKPDVSRADSNLMSFNHGKKDNITIVSMNSSKAKEDVKNETETAKVTTVIPLDREKYTDSKQAYETLKRCLQLGDEKSDSSHTSQLLGSQHTGNQPKSLADTTTRVLMSGDKQDCGAGTVNRQCSPKLTASTPANTTLTEHSYTSTAQAPKSFTNTGDKPTAANKTHTVTDIKPSTTGTININMFRSTSTSQVDMPLFTCGLDSAGNFCAFKSDDAVTKVVHARTSGTIIAQPTTAQVRSLVNTQKDKITDMCTGNKNAGNSLCDESQDFHESNRSGFGDETL